MAESLDVSSMQTVLTSTANGVRVALAIALLAACSVNVTLFWVWL
jgi:hypothetical protein